MCKRNPLPCTLYPYCSTSPRMRALRVTVSLPFLDSTLTANRKGSRQKHSPSWWGEVGAPPGRRAGCAEGMRLDPQNGSTAGNKAEGGGKEPQDFSGLEGKWGLRRKPGREPGSGRTWEGPPTPTRSFPVCLRRPRVPVQVQQQRRLRHPHKQGQPLRRRREPQRSLLFSSGSSLAPQLHLEVQGHGGGSTAAPLTAGVSQRFAAGRSAAEVRPGAALPAPPRGPGKHCACAWAATQTGLAPRPALRGKRKGRGEGRKTGWVGARGGMRRRAPALFAAFSRARASGARSVSSPRRAPRALRPQPNSSRARAAHCTAGSVPAATAAGRRAAAFSLLAYTLHSLKNFLSGALLCLTSV